MERVKAMQRGNAAAEPYRPELLADEEPRYLRRQKPLEIRRKKFGGRSWTFYRRVLVWTIAGATGITCAIVAGLPESMPREEREKRMQTYQEFLRDADLVRSESSDRVSEVDLSNAKDLRVVMTGLTSATDSQAVTIHFGNSDFTAKYRMLVENFAQWQANAGHVQSIDLQYSRQVVVNADSNANSAKLKN